MCGIAGFVDFNKSISLKELSDSINILKHRGPNDSDAVILDSPHASVGMGHRRLSILDLSSLGHQPMYSEDKQVIIILNGEIYNFKEIRETLKRKGYSFISNSDTEVVLNSYKEFGIACLKLFIGMFSFVLFDKRTNEVYMVRDRAGIKPLYYYHTNDCLLFASELKAFHQYTCFKKEINTTALSLYFKYGYIKAPYSIFENTFKLLPGHYAKIDLASRKLEMHQYWNVLDYYNKPPIKIDEEEAVNELESLCISAFQYRMVSDVPIGVFLSGGYDSSIVAALLQKQNVNKIKTFTIGFKEIHYNEAEHAAKVAAYLGTDHNEYYCTSKEAQEIIPQLPFFYDEPFGDSSAIPTILVSRFARQQVTVALSADGGDEVFAGYNRYDQLTQFKKIQKYSPAYISNSVSAILKQLPGNSSRIKKLAELIVSGDDSMLSDILWRHFMDGELDLLLQEKNKKDVRLIDASILNLTTDFINTMLAADYKTYMVDDILTKVDRATMSTGLEGREPLLDHRIVEWSAQIPSSLKYNNGNKKYLLKKIAHKYIPPQLMDRPKMGFGIPVGEWMKTDIKDYMMEYVNTQSFNQYGLINGTYAEQIRDLYLDNKKGYETKVWLLLIFQLWYEKWMK